MPPGWKARYVETNQPVMEDPNTKIKDVRAYFANLELMGTAEEVPVRRSPSHSVRRSYPISRRYGPIAYNPYPYPPRSSYGPRPPFQPQRGSQQNPHMQNRYGQRNFNGPPRVPSSFPRSSNYQGRNFGHRGGSSSYGNRQPVSYTHLTLPTTSRV